MIDQLRVAPLIRLPQNRYQRLKALKKAEGELSQAGYRSDPQSLARRLGWSVEQVHQVLNLSVGVVSLNGEKHQKDRDHRRTPQQLVGSQESPEQMTLQKELLEVVSKCLQSIRDPKERLILMGRFLEGLTLKQLAAPLGWSIENVRLRQKKALAHMRSCLKRHGWTPMS